MDELQISNVANELRVDAAQLMAHSMHRWR